MKHLNIQSVEAISDHYLRIIWANGKTDEINLSGMVREYAALAPLDDSTVFSAVTVGEDGWSLLWPNGAEIGTDTLWRLAREQAGEATPVAEFSEWRVRNHLSLSEAAAALGITRRMVAYYEAGRYLIPRLVGLACKGWELEHGHHF